MPLSDWSSDVFSPDLSGRDPSHPPRPALEGGDQRAHPFIASISFLTSWLRPRGTMRTSSPLATTIRSSTPTSAIRGPSERTRQLVLSIDRTVPRRSEEHTSELQSLMRISYAVFCLNKKKHHNN